MRNQTDKLLRECLGSGDAGAWLARHPEHRELLLPYVELHQALQGSGVPGPTPESVYRSHLELMRALSNQENVRQSRLARLPAALMRLGTVAAAVALTLVAVAGASAAFGGGDGVVDDVFSTLGLNSHADQGINNASPNAERGRDCASPNAFAGHGNADDEDNAADAHTEDVPRCEPNGDGQGSVNDNASDQSDNADDGINNASDEADKGEHSNPNADDGSGNADEGSDNASPNAGEPSSD